MTKNKKYLIFFFGVIIIFIIFVASIFLQQPRQQSASNTTSQVEPTASLQQVTQNTNSTNTANTTGSPSVTLSPLSSSPKTAVEQFYLYYFSSQQNPLANGGYKDNPYLSADFKDVIGKLYQNGNEPVFCPQNKATNIVVGKEQTVYYNNSYLTQEVISQAPPGNRDLYRVLLESTNGKWQIFDINCI